MNPYPIFCLNPTPSTENPLVPDKPHSRPESSSEPVRLHFQDSDFWRVALPPKQIFVQCKKEALHLLALLPEKGFAVVGTRNPQAKTSTYLQKLIGHLSGSDLIIVSGLARGIDTIAHRSALSAGLPTIAILGAGLDHPYPKENIYLREEILQAGGILLTEYAPGTPPRGFQFLERNRLIAGWSKATWVVEAGVRSGALNTAKWAREQNRITFTLPCFPGDSFLAGNQTLLDRDHALAVWGRHSLGAAWLELATSNIPNGKTPPPTLSAQGTSPAHLIDLSATQATELTAEVERRTYEKGGVTPQELMDWAFQQGWDTRDFFLALQKAKTEEALQEQFGVLVRIPFSGGPTHVS